MGNLDIDMKKRTVKKLTTGSTFSLEKLCEVKKEKLIMRSTKKLTTGSTNSCSRDQQIVDSVINKPKNVTVLDLNKIEINNNKGKKTTKIPFLESEDIDTKFLVYSATIKKFKSDRYKDIRKEWVSIWIKQFGDDKTFYTFVLMLMRERKKLKFYRRSAREEITLALDGDWYLNSGNQDLIEEYKTMIYNTKEAKQIRDELQDKKQYYGWCKKKLPDIKEYILDMNEQYIQKADDFIKNKVRNRIIEQMNSNVMFTGKPNPIYRCFETADKPLFSRVLELIESYEKRLLYKEITANEARKIHIDINDMKQSTDFIVTFILEEEKELVLQ